MKKTAGFYRGATLGSAARFCDEAFKPEPFVPGKTYIPVAKQVIGRREVLNLIQVALDGHCACGPYAERFEKALASYVGTDYASFCNSGSSANLLALAALKLRPGREVITTTAVFPTTVNPILQLGLVPVFVDIELGTYNPTPEAIEEAVKHGKTRAIIVSHALGNPCQMHTIMDIALRHDLFVIEDNCDSLGTEYGVRRTGSFGHLATQSFYPAHHISCGEGGAVLTSSASLKIKVESFRDWGRDCTCRPGEHNRCGHRFDLQWGKLPLGYDHKYVYSEIGYNMKATDLQAALGLAQMEALPSFVEARRENWSKLYQGLEDLEDRFILPIPLPGSAPSWFGFALTLRRGDRLQVVRALEEKGVGTRLLFAGNILKQPGYLHIPHRTVGELINTDQAMCNSFWVGVHPGLTLEMVDYMVETIREVSA